MAEHPKPSDDEQPETAPAPEGAPPHRWRASDEDDSPRRREGKGSWADFVGRSNTMQIGDIDDSRRKEKRGG